MQVNIDYRFTSLNDYVAAERTNRHIAAKIKREETEIARLAAFGKQPIGGKFVYPVEIVCQWFRKDGRSDPDNIAFSIKFILDGFVLAGLLQSDGWKYIKNIRHEFNKSLDDYVIVDIT